MLLVGYGCFYSVAVQSQRGFDCFIVYHYAVVKFLECFCLSLRWFREVFRFLYCFTVPKLLLECCNIVANVFFSVAGVFGVVKFWCCCYSVATVAGVLLSTALFVTFIFSVQCLGCLTGLNPFFSFIMTNMTIVEWKKFYGC